MLYILCVPKPSEKSMFCTFKKKSSFFLLFCSYPRWMVHFLFLLCTLYVLLRPATTQYPMFCCWYFSISYISLAFSVSVASLYTPFALLHAHVCCGVVVFGMVLVSGTYLNVLDVVRGAFIFIYTQMCIRWNVSVWKTVYFRSLWHGEYLPYRIYGLVYSKRHKIRVEHFLFFLLNFVRINI